MLLASNSVLSSVSAAYEHSRVASDRTAAFGIRMRPLRLIFAVFRKVKEEVMADRGLTAERMVTLARVSRASYYRFEEGGKSGSDFDTELRDAIQRSRWN